MNKDVMSPAKLMVITGFALSCFGLLLFLWLTFGGPTPLQPKGYRFKVAFSDASTLAEQADVRAAGVSIGKVMGKELAPGGNKTLATIQLEPKYAPMRSDGRAILRQKTLLGETYVELTTGSKRARAVREGGRLADGQVAEAVEFDELLRTFDASTRRAFQQWQKTAAQASKGRAQDINDAVGNLPGFAENAEGVVGVLQRRRAALRSLVQNTGTTFAALTRNEAALQTFIRRNTEVLEALASRRDALAEGIRVFPTFLRETRATLARLRTFSVQTEPLIRDLEPVLEDAQPTLASLGRLAPDAQRLFEDLDPLIAAGRRGFPALARVLRGLDPALARVGPFLQQLNPILQYVELNQAQLGNFINVGGGAIGGKRAVTPGSPSNGHVLPQIITTGLQSLPAAQRTPDNRGNAYLGPQAYAKRPYYTFPSFDCGNSGEKGPSSGSPGCVVQGPLGFQGRTQRFPQPHAAGPGGAG
jgi:virulence factor Mce-like protein